MRGFGLDSPYTAPRVVPDVQPLNQPPGHHISRISLRPQAKLTVNQPGDIFEQEADRVAQQVMGKLGKPGNSPGIQREQMPEDEEELQMKPLVSNITPLVQRQEMPEEEELQMKPLDVTTLQRQQAPEEEEELQMSPMVQRQANAEMAAAPDLEASINQARGGGQPLAENIRQPMEQAFGADFSGVKVHTDGQSDQLNRSIQARAFTTGQDVFFGQGEYNPGSRGGQELLAHELTHVVQQSGGAINRKTLPSLASAPDLTTMAPGSIVHVQRRVIFSSAAPDEAKVLEVWFERPAGTSSSGPHTTAISVFQEAAMNAVLNKTYQDALEALRQLTERIRDLPGYDDAEAEYKRYINERISEFSALITTYSTDENTLNWGTHLDDLGRKYILIRNSIKYVHHEPGEGASGGAGESPALNNLHALVARKDVIPPENCKEVAINILGLIDLRNLKKGAAITRPIQFHISRLIKQHIMTIKQAYPNVTDWGTTWDHVWVMAADQLSVDVRYLMGE